MQRAMHFIILAQPGDPKSGNKAFAAGHAQPAYLCIASSSGVGAHPRSAGRRCGRRCGRLSCCPGPGRGPARPGPPIELAPTGGAHPAAWRPPCRPRCTAWAATDAVSPSIISMLSARGYASHCQIDRCLHLTLAEPAHRYTLQLWYKS